MQLLYPLLYGPHIDALLQDNEEELDSYVWFDKPWRMPTVKAWAAILRLTTSSEGIGTGMFLADLKALIDASSTPDGITWAAQELDARAEGVLKVCDQFTSVSELKNFVRSCLRAEAISSVAARGDKIGYAHGQANNWLIAKRLEGSGLSLEDFAAAIKAAPAPKLTTHLRVLNLFSIANASARRPPALLPFSLPSPAINLAMAPLPLIILVFLIRILPTHHVCLLHLLPRTRHHHRPLPHSGLVSRPRLPLTRNGARYLW